MLSSSAQAVIIVALSVVPTISGANEKVGTRRTFPIRRLDRDRGGGHPPTPPTPPCVRVRTRRFETFGLTLLEQRRKTTIAEIGIRKRDIQGFRMGQMPWAMATADCVIGQPATRTQLNQHCL